MLQIMKEGIKIMIDLFCGGFGMGPRNNRLAIIQFSSAPIIIHYFSDPQTPKALKDKVGSMVDFGGKTCTGDALVLAYREIFQLSRGARPDTPNDTLVVTDGRANCGKDLLQSARLLQQRSQAVYALGIGIAGDVAARAQVTSLVTGEDPHHIFSLARYPDFKEMIDYIKLA
nr:hypothetical protein BaRGS_025537 [Batillaria attramentaria]